MNSCFNFAHNLDKLEDIVGDQCAQVSQKYNDRVENSANCGGTGEGTDGGMDGRHLTIT